MFEITCSYVDFHTGETVVVPSTIVKSDNPAALFAWIEDIYANQYKLYSADRRVSFEISWLIPKTISSYSGERWSATNGMSMTLHDSDTNTREEGITTLQYCLDAYADK